MRGTRTCGYGRVGQHRKTGQRAGRGKTTQWKKSKKTLYLKQKELGFPDPDWKMGKTGFKRPQDINRINKTNTLNVKDLDQDQVYLEIENRIRTTDITDKIVRLKVANIPQYVYNSLDFRRITELKSQAFHLDLRFEKKEEREKAFTAETTIYKLPLEFKQYLNQAVVENLNKDRLLELGLKYLSEQKTADL